jgi:hypothetical protein
MVKHVRVLARRPDVTDAQFDAARAGLRATRVTGARSDRAPEAHLDLPHEHEKARARFARPGLFAVDGLAWDTVETPEPHVFAAGPRLVVEEHLGWTPDDTAGADPDDVVKQVSFLHATAGVPVDEFRRHYRAHVAVARRHMPALWQYVQNDVVEILDADRTPGAVGIVAISELWFRTTDDFLNRYFASAADEAEFRSHEGFLDLRKAFSFICSSHSLRRKEAR